LTCSNGAAETDDTMASETAIAILVRNDMPHPRVYSYTLDPFDSGARFLEPSRNCIDRALGHSRPSRGGSGAPRPGFAKQGLDRWNELGQACAQFPIPFPQENLK